MREVPTLDLCGPNLDRVRRRLDEGLSTIQSVVWAQPQVHGLSVDPREAGALAEPMPPPSKRRAISKLEPPVIDVVCLPFRLKQQDSANRRE